MSFDRCHRVAGGALLSLLPLLSGCYEFEKPLGPPEKGAIDRALVGNWRCQNEPKGLQEKDGKQENTLHFLPFGATQYAVQVRWTEDGAPKDALYRVYSSRVGAHVLLNAQEADTQPKDWSLLRYRIEGPTLTLWLVDDEKVGGKGEEGLRAVRRRVADDSIYEKFLVCAREGGQ